MKETFRLAGTVNAEGILNIDRGAFSQGLKGFVGKEVLITVERVRNYRTASQNAYYWRAVLPCIADGLVEAGYDIDPKDKETLEAIHELLKDNLAGNEIKVEGKEELPLVLPASTSRLTVEQFKMYLERVAKWAAEALNVVIPPPTHPPGYFPEE